MDIRTQAALLAAIVTLALAAAALLRDNRSRVFTLFAVFSPTSSSSRSRSSSCAGRGRSRGLVGAARRSRPARSCPPPASPSSSSSSACAPPRAASAERDARRLAVRPRGRADAARPAPAPKFLVAAYVVGGLVVVLSALWGKTHLSQTRVERARLQYLFIGALFAVALSTLDMLPRFGLPYPLEGLGSITLTIFMFFLSQTLQRHRLLDLHEFLGKIVVVTALGLVLVGDLRRRWWRGSATARSSSSSTRWWPRS